MTLAQACLKLHDLGHVATVLHRDHLCQKEESHEWSQCPAAPYFALSALDLAPAESEADLQALIIAKLQQSLAASQEPACIECGCSELSACEDDGSGEPCHWVSRDPPICSACAPVVVAI